MVNGKRCIAKAKTVPARKTLDPFYQQSLTFKDNCRGCILQVRDTNTENRFSLRFVLCFFLSFLTKSSKQSRNQLGECIFHEQSRDVWRVLSGDGVGWLRPVRREKSVHGYCTDRIGWAEPQWPGDRLVQAVRHHLPGQWTSIPSFVPSIFGHVSRFF